MWLFLPDSHLEIVAHKEDDRFLNVRARISGDIERAFPEATVFESPTGDFQFHANLPKKRVGEVVARHVSEISYQSFKEAVPDDDRRQAYIQVWEAMWMEQRRRSAE
jgi:hypothetical protein